MLSVVTAAFRIAYPSGVLAENLALLCSVLVGVHSFARCQFWCSMHAPAVTVACVARWAVRRPSPPLATLSLTLALTLFFSVTSAHSAFGASCWFGRGGMRIVRLQGIGHLLACVQGNGVAEGEGVTHVYRQKRFVVV